MTQLFSEPGQAGDPRWRALVEEGPFYVATFSPAGRLTSLNRTRGEHPPAHYLGRHISEFLLLGGGPDVSRALRRVADTGRPERLEVPAPIGERPSFKLDLRLLPVRRNGVTTEVVALGLDVTEDSRIALELRMSVNALHRAIESREQLEADLHDGIIQSLYGVGMRLEAARAAMAAPDDAGQYLGLAIEQLKATLAEIRRYIAEGPGRLPASARWDDALAGLLRGLEVGSGPSIGLELDRDAVARVTGLAQSEVTFIAREAVSNAVRHAGAARVTVRLVDDGPRVRLEVEDDGRGFPRERVSEGFGLITMARRAAQIGALLTFQTVSGRGTLVRLDLPVSNDVSARV